MIGSRRDLNFEDISRLKYISCVIKETLRIYPPVLASNRIITKPMKIQGYNIPVGSLVMVSILIINFNSHEQDLHSFFNRLALMHAEITQKIFQIQVNLNLNDS